MKFSAIFCGQRHSICLTDIIICSIVCLMTNGLAYSIPMQQSERRDVKLVPNSFQIIIQNSIPTSQPAQQKASKTSYNSKVLNSYQADQGHPLPWPVEGKIPLNEERELTEVACKLSCPYGQETDVEGHERCECKDPCKGVKCFGGSQCEPKRECIFDKCEFTAECKAPEDVCTLPRPKYTFMCDKLSKKYYFDTKKGLCRKYWGCAKIEGNSFDSKKTCKSVCYNKEQKRRDRKSRQHRKGSKENLSSQPASGQQSNEISNVIPTYKELPSINNLIAEGFEEQHNQIESSPNQPSYPSIFTKQVPGLNQLTGCPKDLQYEVCPFDPCAGCSSSNVMCFTSFCGKCQAIYIDLRTGEATDKFAANC